MTTTQWPEIAPYRLGDLAKIPCEEPDPIPGWAEQTERDAHDMRSIHIGGQLVGVVGYIPETRTQAGAFAVIDRQACAGHGRELARILRQRNRQWMEEVGITTATAFCNAQDRAARVFLRATGYRETGPVDGDTVYFILTWSK